MPAFCDSLVIRHPGNRGNPLLRGWRREIYCHRLHWAVLVVCSVSPPLTRLLSRPIGTSRIHCLTSGLGVPAQPPRRLRSILCRDSTGAFFAESDFFRSRFRLLPVLRAAFDLRGELRLRSWNVGSHSSPSSAPPETTAWITRVRRRRALRRGAFASSVLQRDIVRILYLVSVFAFPAKWSG